MTIIATTRSGNVYRFTQNEHGEMHFVSNTKTGKVVKVHGFIAIGQPIELFYLREKMYEGYEEEISFLNTTRVVNLSISNLISSQ